MSRRVMTKAALSLTASLAAVAVMACSTPSGDPTSAGETGGAGNGGEASYSGHLEVGVLPAEGTTGFDFLVGVGDSIIAEHPDVTIEYTFANTRVRPMMEQRWRAGDPPDLDYFVFNAQVPSTHEFRDRLVDLSPYLDEELADGSGTWRDSFLPGTAAVTDLDGGTYGVVTDTHLITLFYNRTIFEDNGLEPPTTWEEFTDVGDALLADGISPVAVTGMFEPYMGFWLDSLFQREVGYERSREAAFSGDYDDPGFLEAAQKLQQIRDAGYFMPGFEGTDFTAAQMEFFQGNTAMILMGTWLSSEMRDSIPDDFELGLVGFPTIPGAAGDQGAQLAHNNIMVANKDGDNVDLALEYMRRLTSVEVQNARVAETGSVSALRGVPAPEGVEGLEEVLASTEEFNVRYFGLEFVPDRNTAYYREVARFFFGETDAEELIEALSVAMERIPN